MGAFSAKFSTTPRGKTMDGSRKRFKTKMMARTTSITMQNFVEIARCTLAREDGMWCFSLFLKITLVGRRPLWCVVLLLPQDIASAFVGRFRRCLQRVFAEESPFQRMEQFSKLSLDSATIGASMREEIVKIWENGCKVCAHHFDHLETRRKKISTTAFYHMYCRCAPV